jgi:hypothetical protein
LDIPNYDRFRGKIVGIAKIKKGEIVGYLGFKLVHLLGVFFLFSGIGGMVFVSYLESGRSKTAMVRLPRVLHGIGLLVILIGGVMMVYSLRLDGGHGVPFWVKLKMLVLVCFGLLPLLVRRPAAKRFVLPIALLLGLAASFLAVFKPF